VIPVHRKRGEIPNLQEIVLSSAEQERETLNQVIMRIQSLEVVKRELSVGLGGRTIIR